MADILFLAHRIPYPPNKGDKIRSWNFLKRMMQDHQVHLGFFIDNSNDEKYIAELQEQTASLCYETVSPRVQKLMSLRSFLSNQPLTIGAYPYKKLQQYAAKLIEQNEIDMIFLFSAATGPIVPKTCSVPIITDLVDVDSAKWQAYGEKAIWPLSWVYSREAKLLSAYEGVLAAKSAKTYLVSDQEAAVFERYHVDFSGNIGGLKNGVDTEFFSPADTTPDNDTLIFTGAMDYKPNVEAVTWFVEHVWDAVLSMVPSAKLVIAGGPENPAIRKLEEKNGISVTGYVHSMPEVLRGASIAIAPLLTARGIQNKVLEAMACSLPVIATSAANEGIEAKHGEAIMVADTAQPFLKAVVELLTDKSLRKSMGSNAREFVRDEFSWETAYNLLKRDLNKVIVDAK